MPISCETMILLKRSKPRVRCLDLFPRSYRPTLGVIALLLCLGFLASAQSISSPFAVDAEAFYDGLCNPAVGCPIIDEVVAAGAHTIRLLAVWHNLEPQQNVYNWGYLPWQVWYAQTRGIQIYFTATWAPQWANGASSSCPPFAGANMWDSGTSDLPECQNGYTDVGYAVVNSSDTWNFFYNLALQFNGSDTSGCPGNDAATCHPLVQYFGVWNEPNGLNNYWDVNYDPGNLGNYLNDFVTQYVWPAHDGVKAANPSAYVVAPEISTGSSACGGFDSNCDWKNSWMQPLTYFSNSYDIVSIHGYQGHDYDKSNVDAVYYNYAYGKPIWMTEEASPEGPSGVTYEFIDRYNRQSYWAAIFYSLGGYAGYGKNNCPGTNKLLCNDGTSGSANLTETLYFSAYQSAYAPH